MTFVTVCPLGTGWLLISANCLCFELRPSCTLPLQLGGTTILLRATLASTSGRTEGEEMLFNDNSFSVARCGDASRVPRQLSFRWSSSLWLHRQPWETNDLVKGSKAIQLTLYTEHVHTLSWITGNHVVGALRIRFVQFAVRLYQIDYDVWTRIWVTRICSMFNLWAYRHSHLKSSVGVNPKYKLVFIIYHHRCDQTAFIREYYHFHASELTCQEIPSSCRFPLRSHLVMSLCVVH